MTFKHVTIVQTLFLTYILYFHVCLNMDEVKGGSKLLKSTVLGVHIVQSKCILLIENRN